MGSPAGESNRARKGSQRAAGIKRWLTRIVVGLSIAYPVSLVVTIALLRFVGERWWVTGVALYLPRIGFALPLVPLVLGLLVVRAHKFLWTQVVAAVLVVFPLMGLVLPWFSPRVSSAQIRVLSYNVNTSYGGEDGIFQGITQYSPDVVLLQESTPSSGLGERLSERYRTVLVSTQFLLATRFPLLETYTPKKLPYLGERRSPRFMRHLLQTPLGNIAFYNVHPHSPRQALRAMRGEGMKHELSTGRFFRGVASPDFLANAGLRELQVSTIVGLAEREKTKVIIAGDTNLPHLSRLFTRELSGYRDAFRDASSGFGYTFPTRYPWMRIDRILTDPSLVATTFSVDCGKVSDHHCVVADIGSKPE